MQGEIQKGCLNFDHAIYIESLSKCFGKNQALDIDKITINKGDMVGLLGPSGSGKSTLLKHLNGLMTADKKSGSLVRVLNETVQQSGKISRNIRKQRSHIGCIFQQFNLINQLSALDNVLVGAMAQTAFARTAIKFFNKTQKNEALQLLDRVGLGHVAHQRVSSLSGGQQQRVAIARSLMQKAKIILADEPIASLDPEASKTVMRILRDICITDGITVVVTLHQVDYALDYCQRIIALKQGKVFYDGLANALKDDQITNLYQNNTNHSLDQESIYLSQIKETATL